MTLSRVTVLFSVVLVWILSAGTSCERGERIWTLQYRVKVLAGIGEFSVKYLNPNQSETQVGGLTSDWESSVFTDVESGTLVSLEIRKTNGDQMLQLEILRDGAVHESAILSQGESTLTISDAL